ncbi:hypothetical protein ABIE45_004521 [Methylobacterium sp. OAE515]|uniref:hypothetical protein n=1 Tax=Methylobacterium sp. OAE515 TaxID=2817895 RepID=UPI00178C13FD
MSRVVGLLRTEDPVVLRLAEQPPAALRVTDAPVRLALTPVPSTLLVTDQQGPPGPAGPQGGPGDYGYIRYDEITATPIMLVPGEQKPFTLTAPLMMANSLRGPFTDFSFLDPDGCTVRARADGDSYDIRVRFSVVAQIAEGAFQTNFFVIGNTSGIQGAAATRARTLVAPAGTSERVDELFQVFPGSGFKNNGALVMVQSSVPCVVSPESLFVRPTVAAA